MRMSSMLSRQICLALAHCGSCLNGLFKIVAAVPKRFSTVSPNRQRTRAAVVRHYSMRARVEAAGHPRSRRARAGGTRRRGRGRAPVQLRAARRALPRGDRPRREVLPFSVCARRGHDGRRLSRVPRVRAAGAEFVSGSGKSGRLARVVTVIKPAAANRSSASCVARSTTSRCTGASGSARPGPKKSRCISSSLSRTQAASRSTTR